MNANHPNPRQLEDLAIAAPERPSDLSILDHVERCGACQSWVDTYRLLAQTLRQDPHPSSQHLAQYAADSALLEFEERQAVTHHLSSCSRCQDHVDLTVKALEKSRESAPQARLSGPSESPTWLALAASLLLLLGLGWTFWPTSSPIAPAVSAELSQESFRGTHLIEASHSIMADSVTVESGGNVIFRAGERVVLNDGFSVDEGGSFQIEIGGLAEKAGG